MAAEWSYATIHKVPVAHSILLGVLVFFVVLVVMVVVVDSFPCSETQRMCTRVATKFDICCMPSHLCVAC
jgi:sensor domain CHASE-containing protein